MGLATAFDRQRFDRQRHSDGAGSAPLLAAVDAIERPTPSAARTGRICRRRTSSHHAEPANTTQLDVYETRLTQRGYPSPEAGIGRAGVAARSGDGRPLVCRSLSLAKVAC